MLLALASQFTSPLPPISLYASLRLSPPLSLALLSPPLNLPPQTLACCTVTAAAPPSHPSLPPFFRPLLAPPPSPSQRPCSRAPVLGAGGRVGSMRRRDSGVAAVGPALAVREPQGGGAGRVVQGARPHAAAARAGPRRADAGEVRLGWSAALIISCPYAPIISSPHALMLQQLVLAQAGQMQGWVGVLPARSRLSHPSFPHGLMPSCPHALIISCYSSSCRPMPPRCRAAFEKQYGSIRDNTLIVSARRPIYCPKILELTTLYATNGPSNVDMFQRYYSMIPLVEAGRHFYSWPYPLANPLTHAGFDPSKSFELYDITDPASLFAIVHPSKSFELYDIINPSSLRHHPSKSFELHDTTDPASLFAIVHLPLPPLPPSLSADPSKSFELHDTTDPASLFAIVHLPLPPLPPSLSADPSKSFELYDITDPASLFAIVSPVPPHVYFRPDDKLPYMRPSPDSETRPWEQRAVVSLEEMGAGVRKYEVWCRQTQPPSTWQQWGIPILIALFALLLVLLVLLAACLQRAKFFQTQQQMAEADRLRRQAEGAEASKSMFVACMSHELRTPMVGITGMLDALAEMGLNASQLADLLMAGASARDALHLVNRVLDLAKLEAGKAVVDETVIDVREWLHGALEWHAEEARSKGIELSGIVSDGCPTHVIADPMHLTTMVKEITDNAVKFTTQGHVTVRVTLVPQGTSLHDTLCCQGLPPAAPQAAAANTAYWPSTWLCSRWECLIEAVRGAPVASAAGAVAAAAAAAAAATAAAAAGSARGEGGHERRHGSQDRKHIQKPDRGRGRRQHGTGHGIGRGSGQGRGGERWMLVLSCQDSGCGLPASLHTASGTEGPSYFSLLVRFQKFSLLMRLLLLS
ncbi:unnamed protein product [Closterium sp. Naga37s-1]|nr:unnamed protein product [Closterium sp. Naga37s-1]